MRTIMTIPDPIPGAREHFILDPAIAFLNHGSFGATPRPVLAAQDAWRARMEADPVLFLDRQWADLLDEARQRAATFLRADAGGLAFVRNATTGINTIVGSLGLRADDEVIFTDHAYPAVSWFLRSIAARPIIVPIALGEPDVVSRITDAITPRTRLVVVDHIASATGVIFPVEQIVRACHDRGVLVAIDAAHAPGMVDADIDGLAPDFWTGNFHKWVCAPKGAAALWVAGHHRARVRPVVTSHEHLVDFHERLEWQGTDDPTAFLSVSAALDFAESLGGWARIRAHNDLLVRHGRALVADAVSTEQIVPTFASMTIVELPAGVVGSREDGIAMTRALYEGHGVEVPIVHWGGRGFARLSAHVYNTPDDYARLADALPRVLHG